MPRVVNRSIYLGYHLILIFLYSTNLFIYFLKHFGHFWLYYGALNKYSKNDIRRRRSREEFCDNLHQYRAVRGGEGDHLCSP